MYSRSSDVESTDPGVEEARRRRRWAAAIGKFLRELAIQLSLLNHQIGAQLDLQDVDIDCLDLIDRLGPLSPSALARLAGLHPATITGIVDRLERGGWVVRERDPRHSLAATGDQAGQLNVQPPSSS